MDGTDLRGSALAEKDNPLCLLCDALKVLFERLKLLFEKGRKQEEEEAQDEIEGKEDGNRGGAHLTITIQSTPLP